MKLQRTWLGGSWLVKVTRATLECQQRQWKGGPAHVWEAFQKYNIQDWIIKSQRKLYLISLQPSSTHGTSSPAAHPGPLFSSSHSGFLTAPGISQHNSYHLSTQLHLFPLLGKSSFPSRLYSNATLSRICPLPLLSHLTMFIFVHCTKAVTFCYMFICLSSVSLFETVSYTRVRTQFCCLLYFYHLDRTCWYYIYALNKYR